MAQRVEKSQMLSWTNMYDIFEEEEKKSPTSFQSKSLAIQANKWVMTIAFN